MQVQKCLHCGESKPLTQFPLNGTRNGKQRRRSNCKECDRKRTGQSESVAARNAAEIIRDQRKDLSIQRLRKENRHLTSEVSKALQRVNFIEKISRPPKITKTSKSKSAKRDATAVLLCSDWHIEEPVESEKVNGLNEYSLDIAADRIRRLQSGLLWKINMLKGGYNIDNIIVWLGGDLFSGYIHDELIEESQLSPIESVLWLKDKICSMLNNIQQATGANITVPCSYGNHGRTTHKMRIATGAENSYEWLLYKQIEQTYSKHKSISVVAPKSQLCFLDVYGFKMRFHHGDSIRYGGGVGGLLVPLKKAISNWDRAVRADITCIGHFHQLQFLPNAVTNGSLIGYGPYSVRIKAEYEPPQQAFFLVDSERGITCASGIWVDD